jgi:glutathione S-transferase
MTTTIPKLQFIYFAVRARCEAPRMILEYGKIPYTDSSVGGYFGGKSWPEVKAAGLVPFGQLPVLVVSGNDGSAAAAAAAAAAATTTLLAQEAAISWYCATLVPGLLPEDPLLRAQCEAIFHAAEELSPSNPVVNVFKGETFAAKKEDYLTNILPRRLRNFHRLLANSGGPFTMGASPTYADFKLYHHLSNTRLIDATALDQCGDDVIPTFMAAVEGLPGVKEYLERRPAAIDVGTKPMLEPNVCGSRFVDPTAAPAAEEPDAKKAKKGGD